MKFFIVVLLFMLNVNLYANDKKNTQIKSNPLTASLVLETKKIEIRKNNKNISEPIKESIVYYNNSSENIYFELVFQESIYKNDGTVDGEKMKNIKSEGNVPSLLPYLKYEKKEYFVKAKSKIIIPIEVINQSKIYGTHFVHFFAKEIQRRDNYVIEKKEEVQKAGNTFLLMFKGSITFTNLNTGDYKLDIQPYYIKANKKLVFQVKNVGTNVVSNLNIFPMIIDDNNKVIEKLKILNLKNNIMNPNKTEYYLTDFTAHKFDQKTKLRLLIISELDKIHHNMVMDHIISVKDMAELEKKIK